MATTVVLEEESAVPVEDDGARGRVWEVAL